MIRALLVTLAVVLPAAGRADTVRVRSGEHADFTRLLIEFRQPEDWVFGRVDGGYEFRPARPDIDYDLRRTFDLIPRTRIADVTDRGDGRLFLSVACACHAELFDLQLGQVVLDIKDGPPPADGSVFEARLDTAPGGDTATTAQGPSERRAGLPLFPAIGSGGYAPPGAATLVAVPMIDPTGPADSAPPTPAPDIAPPVTEAEPPAPVAVTEAGTHHVGLDPEDSPATTPEAVDPGGSDRVSETERALLEEIARAAAQGLLEADMRTVVDQVEAATRPRDPDQSAPATPEPVAPLPLPPVAPRGHISIETSIDRAAADTAATVSETEDGLACLDDTLVDVASWGGPETDGGNIGAYRSRIVGEFDIADRQGITDLARHYVYITFGAEAKALIRRYPNDVTRPDLLISMAEVMDQGHANAPLALVDQMACDGAIALWAALAQPELYRGQAINAAAVARSFTGLPPHLRRHLGPGLAERFIAIGDTETAEILQNAVARVEPVPSVPLEMVAAQLEIAEGETDAASTRLDAVVARADEDLPAALLDRAEAALGAGLSVPEDVIALLDSVAFEMRGTETGARLRDAEIRSLISASQHEIAFAKLAQARDGQLFETARIAVLTAELYADLDADAGDENFLRLVIPRIDEATVQPAAVRRRLAERFVSLGLADPARQILGGEGALPEPEDRVIFARIAMLDHRPEVAIGYLAGLDTSEADRLRAEALAAAEDHAGAVRAFGEIGATDGQKRAAWQGGLWETVDALDDGVVAAAARLMTGDRAASPPAEGSPEAAPDQPGTPLARSQALVDESRAARATLEALLQEVATVPDAGPN